MISWRKWTRKFLDPYKQFIQGKKYFRHSSRIGLHLSSCCCWWCLLFTADHLILGVVSYVVAVSEPASFLLQEREAVFLSFLYVHIHYNSLWRFSMWIPISLIDLHLNTDTSSLPLYPSSSSGEWMRETFVERDESEDEGEEQRKRSIETVIKRKQKRWRQERGRQEATGKERKWRRMRWDCDLKSRVRSFSLLSIEVKMEVKTEISVSQTKPLDSKSNEWLITVSFFNEDRRFKDRFSNRLFWGKGVQTSLASHKGSSQRTYSRKDLILLLFLFHPKEKRNWLKSWPEMLLRCPRIRMRHRETDSVFFSRW